MNCNRPSCGNKPGLCECGQKSYGLSLVSYGARVVNFDQILENPCTERYDPLKYQIDWDISITNIKQQLYNEVMMPRMIVSPRSVAMTFQVC